MTPSIARWARPAWLGLSVAILAAGSWIAAYRWGAVERNGYIGIDLEILLTFTRRWLDSGSMYLAAQLTGPFDPQSPNLAGAGIPSMYPPHAVYLFMPFLILPRILWWAIPLGTIAHALTRWRPAPRAWPLLALIAVLPNTYTPVMVGSSTMWLAAFVAAGLLWGWPGVLVTLKPSLLPFAIVGVGRRSWWVAAVAMACFALPLWSAWVEYATVVRNARVDMMYSLGSVPAMLLPLVGWAARRQGEDSEARRDRRMAAEPARPL
jgi:hypothetical protein